MNKFRFYMNKLMGKPSVGHFTLLGQDVTLGISTAREIRRANDIEIESELIDHMRPVFQPGDLLYDIGANIGLISILMAKYKTGVSAQVFCFEPEPKNFNQLSNNIQLNQLSDRVSCHQMALGATEGEIALHVRGNAGEGRHSIATDKGATDSIQVTLKTLSGFAAESGKAPTIVKIDVEGAEGQVLAGMDTLMSTQPPREIFMEIHPKGDGDAMPNGEPIHEWLEQRGYAMQWSNKRGSGEHRHYQYAA